MPDKTSDCPSFIATEVESFEVFCPGRFVAAVTGGVRSATSAPT